jgi:uncharacterized protein
LKNGWKISRFNTIVDSGEYSLFYNSRYKTYAKLKKIYTEKLFEDLNCIPIDIVKQLRELGMIVSSDNDEEKFIEYSYLKHIFDPELHLTLLSSEQCNFRCSYCYEKFERGNMTEEVANSIITWLRKNIKNYPSVQVSWFGGEPLLGIKNIINISEQIKELCARSKRPYSSGMTTNGYLLSLKNFEKLLKCNIRSYCITIDGIQETHDQYRKLVNGKGSFSRIINNLRDIRDNCKTQAFKIIIRCNLTSDNAKYIEEYMKLMHSEFANDKRFSFFFRPVGDWGGSCVKEIENKLLNQFSDIYEPIIELSKKYPLNYSEYKLLLNDAMCDSSKENALIVGSDGSLYKCTMLFDKDENKLGHLTKNGEMILNIDKNMNWVLGNRSGISNECMTCPFSISCQERTCAAKGWLLSSNGKCGYEQSSIQYVMKLLDTQGLFNNIEERKKYEKQIN